MILKNKRMVYDVEHQNTSLKLTGNFTVDEIRLITSFNGQFMEPDTMDYVGSFNYNEDNQDKVNKSISGVYIDKQSEASEALDELIVLIKTELNK